MTLHSPADSPEINNRAEGKCAVDGGRTCEDATELEVAQSIGGISAKVGD